MVSIVVVNYNAGKLLYDTVISIYNSQQNIPYEIIVVDNNSNDNSLNKISESDNLILKKLNKNIGFGAACNYGALISKFPYILFLNPDTKFYKVNLEKIIEIYNSDKSIGVVGVKNLDENFRVRKSCAFFPKKSHYLNRIFGLSRINGFNFPGRFMEIDYLKSQFVDQVIGAFFFVSKNNFKNAKMFDERFFVYYEELDFSFNLFKKFKLKNFFFSEMEIIHIGEGTTKSIKEKRLFYSWSSRIKFFKKNNSYIDYISIIIITLIIEPLIRILKSLITLNFTSILEILKAYYKLLKSFKN
jgi:GT2 family glycosyltransferase